VAGAAILVDVQAFSKYNDCAKYLLTVTDLYFSKYVRMIQLKSKTGAGVANTLQKILKERKAEKLWVDKGTEFYNKDVQKLITLNSTVDEEKSSVVERWNRWRRVQRML